MGIRLDEPFPLYPDGFPSDLIGAFERDIGRTVLGNRPASGTEIIAELGEEHLRTGSPIVYTSGDSVFQIATHKSVVDLPLLYEWSRAARRLLTGPHNVGRVIARPFEGEPGAFVRSPERRDFSVPPPGPTVLDTLQGAGVAVLGVGKIQDIFSGQGITEGRYSDSNDHGVDLTHRVPAEASACVRLHQPGRLRLEVRPPERPSGLRRVHRGVRQEAAGADRGAGRGRVADHGRSRVRPDDSTHGPLSRADAVARRGPRGRAARHRHEGIVQRSRTDGARAARGRRDGSRGGELRRPLGDRGVEVTSRCMVAGVEGLVRRTLRDESSTRGRWRRRIHLDPE